MSNARLFELFPAKYRDDIRRYYLRLPEIFKKYDVVIFMARKAICFYKALLTGGFVEKPRNGCQVYSSRVLTYNVADKLKDKRVIVIDDVLIRGNSVKKTLDTLSNFGVNADVLIMARPPITEEETDVLAGKIINCAKISKEDTLQLSKNIAEFIEASVCPYNIDQPIYAFRDFDEETVSAFAERHMLIDISSDLQRTFDIKSFILEIPTTSLKNVVLQRKIELCKIRFLFGQRGDKPVFLAIPFVLLGEISYDELTEAFDSICTDQLYMYIFNKDNKKIFRENQFKILHYVLGAQLMDAFLPTCNTEIVSHRLDSNDDFVFADDIFQLSEKIATNSITLTPIPQNAESAYDHKFKRYEYHYMANDFLRNLEFDKCDSLRKLGGVLLDNYYDTDNVVIDTELLILSELKNYILCRIKDFDCLTFSIVVDILIDTGVIIPSVVHGRNETIVRAYKCGEVHALNKKYFELFTYALKKYLNGLGRNYLLKTEFEKLCVLFFREVVSKGILQSKETMGEENKYSELDLRVSTSKPIYSADSKSTLAAKLLNLGKESIQYLRIGKYETAVTKDSHNGETSETLYDSVDLIVERYIVDNVETVDVKNAHWKSEADLFAANYVEIVDKLFSADDGKIMFNDVRNMYMTTYLEFLIMLSIGSSKKNQLLSLIAEIYLYAQVEINVDANMRLALSNKYRFIVDALLGGMWKYMCYVQKVHPINKLCSNLLGHEDKSIKLMGEQIKSCFTANTDADLNENIEPLIKETGKLIVSMFYSLWFMFERYKVPYFVNDIQIDLSESNKREFYYKEFADLRKTIETQVRTSSDEENIAILRGFQVEAESLIERYDIDIAEGRSQAKKTPTPKRSKKCEKIEPTEEKVKLGIVTALDVEFDTMACLISNLKEDIHQKEYVAGNRYYTGEIASNDGGVHKIVLALLPRVGNNFAAVIATKMLGLYPTLESIIICGIAGGVPSVVRLGDVVVSTNGIMQYDYSENKSSHFIPQNEELSCKPYLLDAVKDMKADILTQGNKLERYICAISSKAKEANFSRPSDLIELYESKDIDLNESEDNSIVEKKYSIKERTAAVSSKVYYEKIGLSNVVKKNAQMRDLLHAEHQVYAIEMEASGIAGATLSEGNDYIVVRGICDYCDKTKNDNWHNYAAAIAAAYTRSFIEALPTKEKN